jgi:hypothetical protein
VAQGAAGLPVAALVRQELVAVRSQTGAAAWTQPPAPFAIQA